MAVYQTHGGSRCRQAGMQEGVSVHPEGKPEINEPVLPQTKIPGLVGDPALIPDNVAFGLTFMLPPLETADSPACHVVIPCGGTGSRAGAGLPKQYRTVAGKSVLTHTLRAFAAAKGLQTVLVVVSPEDTVLDESALRHEWESNVCGPVPRLVVCRQAGSTRAHTVKAGVAFLSAAGATPSDWVLVHDAARCLVTTEQINALIAACLPDPVGGLLALKLPDTLKQAHADRVAGTVPRDDKWLAQTPQMFRLGMLGRALAQAEPSGYSQVTDEASAIEALGLTPLLVSGSAENFKLTYPADFALAEAILESRSKERGANCPSDSNSSMNMSTPHTTAVLPLALRIGEGWDCHALVPGRRLMLGGVQVPHTHGLLGHSDADVLLHAITDAILGGAGLGDIGRHFPDTDPTFKGADSRRLLGEAMTRVRSAGWMLVNLDCTVVAQAPKLASYLPAMCESIAATLGVKSGQINVKAKTAERLGPVGQGLSLEARAVALLAACPA